jgi:hypothetical protein
MTIVNRLQPNSEHETRQAERLYARSCILTSWVICALLTAVIAWTLRQPPFSAPPIVVQLSALVVNGLCWWLCTTRIWFKLEPSWIRRTSRAERVLARLMELRRMVGESYPRMR